LIVPSGFLGSIVGQLGTEATGGDSVEGSDDGRAHAHPEKQKSKARAIAHLICPPASA
jgi:hypothetical protein